MIQKTMNNGRITAVSAAVISENGENFLSFGPAVDEDSLFYIGSLSKAFTGLAILYSEEAGQISLQDSITTYIPSFEIMY